MNPQADLLKFLIENNGVLVTTDAAGDWCCQQCGARHILADRIEHSENCLFAVVKADFEAKLI